MDFFPAVKSCLRQYATFTGRAPRSEYWFFMLFVWLIETAAELGNETFATWLSLALVLPTMAVAVRRMHDIGRSGWWALVVMVPLFGWILWLMWTCTPGWRRYNRFGPDPLPAHAPNF